MTTSLLTLPLRLGLRSVRLALRGAGELAERGLMLAGGVVEAIQHVTSHPEFRDAEEGGGPAPRDDEATFDLEDLAESALEDAALDVGAEVEADVGADVDLGMGEDAEPDVEEGAEAGGEPEPPSETDEPEPEPEPEPPIETDEPEPEPASEARDVEPAPRTGAPVPIHVSSEPELVEEVADTGAEDGAGAQVRIAEPWEGYRLLTAADVIDRLQAATPAELAAVELYELAGRRRQSILAAADQALKRSSRPRGSGSA